MRLIKSNWDKIALFLILGMTGFLNFYSISNEGFANQYYSAAVRSMLSSWHNFFFVAFDPGGYVTVDKPALGLWLQAISAFIFGYHGWSLILPEALSAVISVALIYHIVKRSFGKTAGLAASFALGLTPILIAVSRTNNLDSSLVMVTLFAAWALIVAAERNSFKLLLLSMVLVGVGFNIKMLEAFLILPAFYAVYLFTTNKNIIKRIAELAGATAVLLIVSLSWAFIVDMTPSADRPYVGSSSTNSVVELALGYNGIQRLIGRASKGIRNQNVKPKDIYASASGTDRNNSAGASDREAVNNNNQRNNAQQRQSQNSQIGYNQNMPQPPVGMPNEPAGQQRIPNGYGGQQVPGGSKEQGGQPRNEGLQDRVGLQGQGGPGGIMGGPGGSSENGAKGILRMFNNQLAGQISWLLPMALFGILILLIKAFNKENSNRRNIIRSLILWSVWIGTMIVYFSIAAFYHRYYLSMLSPGIAALTGIGIAEMWQAYRGKGWKWAILPVALLTNAAVQGIILWRYAEWRLILVPVVGIGTIIAVLTLVVMKIFRNGDYGKVKIAAVVIGFAALLVAPGIWASTPLMYGSQTTLPYSGPELKRGNAMGPNNQQRSNVNSPDSNNSTNKLIEFLLSKKQGEKFILAVPDANSAAPIIIKTGEAVMAVGGFSGSDNILTVERLEQMVSNGELRYFQVGGRGMGQQSEITNWVMSHGKAVNPDETASTGTTGRNSSNTNGFGQFGDRMGTGTIYDLAPEKG